MCFYINDQTNSLNVGGETSPSKPRGRQKNREAPEDVASALSQTRHSKDHVRRPSLHGLRPAGLTSDVQPRRAIDCPWHCVVFALLLPSYWCERRGAHANRLASLLTGPSVSRVPALTGKAGLALRKTLGCAASVPCAVFFPTLFFPPPLPSLLGAT